MLEDLHRFLSAHQHASGVIKLEKHDCVNLIYSQNWDPQALCEAFETTGDKRFLRTALAMADFFTRSQLTGEVDQFVGSCPGGFNVAKDFPGGNLDDEGNLYDLYTSWGAGPIVYGLERLLPAIESLEETAKEVSRN